MGDSVGVITVARTTYRAPTIHVVFVGIQGKEKEVQTIPAEPETIGQCKEPTLEEIIKEAASQRFFISSDDVDDPMVLDLTGTTTVYRSTALTIAPKNKIEDIKERVVIEACGESDLVPMKPLFLLVHVQINKLARVRAQAAYKIYSALKTEANVQGITFSDTKFADMCKLKCPGFLKALDRVSSSPTPTDGKTVMMLEERIAAYRADLPALKRDLEKAAAEKELVC